MTKNSKSHPASAEATSSKKTSSSTSPKKPTTMAELLAQTEQSLVVPKKGESIKGKVKNIDKKMLIIDLGAKTEGIVADKEFQYAKDYISEMKVGDVIEATVVSSENDRGQVLLSLKQAAFDAQWDFFIEALEENTILDAKGLETNKGGLIVLVNGVRGFVPSSQFGKQYMGSYQDLKNKDFKVRAIEVDREKNRLIFSERHVSEADELAQREQALEQVETGKIYEGVVSGVMPFGLFVTVAVPVKGSDSGGHVEGLVHISEISWEKVNHPRDYHKVGDKVKVKVLGLDDNTGKLNLSLKQLTDDPWQEIDKNYSVGTTLTGKVSRVEPFGVFVNVEPGVDGLIHASKLAPDQQYQRGEEVTVAVESVDPVKRRMSLSVVLTEVPVGYR